MAALAVLAICAADAAGPDAGPDAGTGQPRHAGLIKLTVNEIRRLINVFVIRPIRNLAHRLHWSGCDAATRPERDDPTTSAVSTPSYKHDPERRLPY